ncbi:fluoride efflux transporter CrcB, partial [Bacillus sp. SIMBA_008]
FLLGYIIGNGVTTSWQLLLGTGFMGAFTTFSTFKLESIQLFNRKNFGILFLYLSTTYIIGILFAFLGMKLGGI